MQGLNFFNKYPLRRSITLANAFITVAALFVANLLFLGYVHYQARQNLGEDVTSLARLLADRSSAAVLFDDQGLAEENLASAKSKHYLALACTYDRHGKLFAKLPNPDYTAPCPPPPESRQHVFAQGFLDHFEPILLRDERIGTVFVRASLSELDALWRNYLLLALVIVFVTGILANLVSNRILTVIAEPLTQLTRTAQHIARRSREEHVIDDDARILTHAAGELGTLIGAFNDMLDQIRERDRFLRDANDMLEERVRRRTEALNISNQQLQRLATDLRHAKEMAEAANVAKSNFLARMSHELRTPLNAILGFSQLMARDPETPPDHRDQLGIINRSGEHLLSMINDVLDLSKIEAGKMELAREVFDLHHLCSEAVELMQVRAAEKGLAVKLTIAPDVPAAIRSDSGKLRQILINLLGNAVKFSRQGEIRLDVTTPRTGILRCAVSDSGIGIPAEMQADIFDPFVQANTHVKGTGLGLAITRRFVEMMGGQIGLQSTPDVGSCFWLEIPAEWSEKQVRPDSVAEYGHVIGLAPGQPVWRILAAEDDPDSQFFIERLMHQIGVEIRIARNGEEAVHQFREWHPDLILMDIRMPVLDGMQATRLIRALPGGDLPIIALTASVFREEQPAIIAAGCTDILFKPLKVEELFAKIAEVLPVRYRYDQDMRSAPPQADAAALQQAARELAEPVRTRLLEAARRLDGDTIEAEIDAIASEHPALAQEIRLCLIKYDFARIAELIGTASMEN